MKRLPAVIDTNVVVAGLLTADPTAPTARILDAMLAAEFPFLLSLPLLTEYRSVLQRPAIRRRHRLDDDQIDRLLVEITFNGIVVEPAETSKVAPDSADQHVWDLLASRREALLVTGDTTLRTAAPSERSILSPRSFVELLDSRDG